MNRLREIDERLLYIFTMDGLQRPPAKRPYLLLLTFSTLMLAFYIWDTVRGPGWYTYVLAGFWFLFASYQWRQWWRSRKLK